MYVWWCAGVWKVEVMSAKRALGTNRAMAGWVNVEISAHRAGNGKVGTYVEHLERGMWWKVL
jgi:hypothetical protein